MGGAVADEQTRDNLVADDPVVDDLAADEPLADDPVVDDLPADEPLADNPLVDDSLADDSVADGPAADEPVANDLAADELITDDPAADDPVADDLVVDDPVVDDLGSDGLRPDDLSGEPDSAGSGDARDVDAATGAPSTDAGKDTAENVAEDAIEEELPELDDHELEKALEALLLVVDTPVEEDVLATALGTNVDRVIDALNRMAGHLGEHERGFDLRRAGGGWRYYTRDKYAPYVEKMLLDGQRAKLTRAALETLAVIAYRQPVTRARVAAVRGVNCDGVIRTLLARGLVEETGTDVDTGGYLYRTTELFLERLGLSSLEDLPPIAPLLPEVDSIDDI
jgi:segregation and condensation protein B